jgi:hypothetical protein
MFGRSSKGFADGRLEGLTQQVEAPPLTPPLLSMTPPPTTVSQSWPQYQQNVRYGGSSANMMSSGVPAMNDADVRRAEHPEEFRCAHGIWPGTYCGMCKRMI